jgi:hypothetical protein
MEIKGGYALDAYAQPCRLVALPLADPNGQAHHRHPPAGARRMPVEEDTRFKPKDDS